MILLRILCALLLVASVSQSEVSGMEVYYSDWSRLQQNYPEEAGDLGSVLEDKNARERSYSLGNNDAGWTLVTKKGKRRSSKSESAEQGEPTMDSFPQELRDIVIAACHLIDAGKIVNKLEACRDLTVPGHDLFVSRVKDICRTSHLKEDVVFALCALLGPLNLFLE